MLVFVVRMNVIWVVPCIFSSCVYKTYIVLQRMQASFL